MLSIYCYEIACRLASAFHKHGERSKEFPDVRRMIENYYPVVMAGWPENRAMIEPRQPEVRTTW